MTNFTEAQIDAFDQELETKVTTIREGSSLRTADELCVVFIEDACGLLGNTFSPELESIELTDGYASEEDSEELSDAARECDERLVSAGFTTVWNDGYVIYKDLSEDCAEYLAEVM